MHMKKTVAAPESMAAVIPSDLLTAREVARRLGVAKSALYEWLARGDIARAILYMHYVYGLPFDRVIDDRNRLLDWANSDPVDEEELRLEENIRALQPGSHNPLVAPAGAQS